VGEGGFYPSYSGIEFGSFQLSSLFEELLLLTSLPSVLLFS